MTFGAFLLDKTHGFLTAEWSQVGISLSSQGTRDRIRENGLKLYQGSFRLDIKENFLTERVVQDSVGVTSPREI